MEIAALVVGIIAVLLGAVPCCPILGIILGIISAILGIVVVVKKKGTDEPKGKAIAGIVLGVIAVVGAIIWITVGAAGMMSALNEINSSSSYYNY